MLDPYVRTALAVIPAMQSRGEATYGVQFQAPDRHGVFKFMVDWYRPGYVFCYPVLCREINLGPHPSPRPPTLLPSAVIGQRAQTASELISPRDAEEVTCLPSALCRDFLVLLYSTQPESLTHPNRYSFISVSDTASVVPLRHDEYPRFIVGAYPYYAGTFSVSAAFLLFCASWMMLGDGAGLARKGNKAE